MRSAKHIGLGIVILTVCWAGCLAVTRPLHAFPLNDSWSYAMMVRDFVLDGQYVLQDWLAGPMVTQLLWGGLFCLPGGFSFEALQVSTMVIGWVGLVFTFLLLTDHWKSYWLALLATLLVALNPLYFSLSVTFMTDIHFFGFFVMSIYFYQKHTHSSRLTWLIAGSLAALLATFTRQFGVVVPLAYFLSALISRRSIFNKKNLLLSIPPILILGLYFMYTNYIDSLGMLSDNYRSVGDLFNVELEELGWRIFIRTGLILLECGFWLFPLLMFFMFRQKGYRSKDLKIILPLMVIFLIPMVRMVLEIPAGNIISEHGVGPVTTRDTFIDQLDLGQPVFSWVWYVIRAMAFLGGMIILYLVFRSFLDIFRAFGSDHEESGPVSEQRIIAIMILLYTAILMINFVYFDRYMLPMLVLLILFTGTSKAIGGKLPKPFFHILLGFVLIMGFYSITETQQYLEWNRDRWEMANRLMGQGVRAEAIDGGHEFNGWHGAEIRMDGTWDTCGYIYVISFNKLPGYQVIQMQPQSTGNLYLLKNNN